MVTKRALQRFEQYFTPMINKENLIKKDDTNLQFLLSKAPKDKISSFKFESFNEVDFFEYGTTISIPNSIHSFVEFKPQSGIVSKIIVEEGVEFKLDFYAHSNTVVLLECEIQKNASCTINGYYSAKEGKNWIYVQLLHRDEKSRSDLKVLGYCSNSAECINDGLVQIGRKAHSSSGYQTMNNYILSNKVKIYSEPQLEIFNPNVECSHGCTISPIDTQVLHYLESRGLSCDEGIELMQDSMHSSFLERAGRLNEE